MGHLKELKNNKELRKEKAKGCLSGLAIGDSLGDAARTSENHENFGITMDFDQDTWSTDDTEFALLTAKILLDSEGDITSEKVVEHWREHVVTQQELDRGGGSEKQAAFNLQKGITPPESGKYNVYHMSDGAAMRVPPIGIVFAGRPKKAAEVAKLDAQVSHWRDGIWGAQAVAAGVAEAMVGKDVTEIIDTALSFAKEESWFAHNFKTALRITEKANSFEDAWSDLHSEIWSEYRAAVPEAIPQALALFKMLGEGSFRRCLIYSSNFGRDADTIGATVGALCGALRGYSRLPQGWVEQTRYPTGTCLEFTGGMDILKTAEKLSNLI